MDGGQVCGTAEDLLAAIDAATTAAARADRDQAAATVLLRGTAEEALDAALRVRKLSRRWIRDGVKVFEAARELERRQELLSVAQDVRTAARDRLDDAKQRTADASRQLACVTEHPG